MSAISSITQFDTSSMTCPLINRLNLIVNVFRPTAKIQFGVAVVDHLNGYIKVICENSAELLPQPSTIHSTTSSHRYSLHPTVCPTHNAAFAESVRGEPVIEGRQSEWLACASGFPPPCPAAPAPHGARWVKEGQAVRLAEKCLANHNLYPPAPRLDCASPWSGACFRSAGPVTRCIIDPSTGGAGHRSAGSSECKRCDGHLEGRSGENEEWKQGERGRAWGGLQDRVLWGNGGQRQAKKPDKWQGLEGSAGRAAIKCCTHCFYRGAGVFTHSHTCTHK